MQRTHSVSVVRFAALVAVAAAVAAPQAMAAPSAPPGARNIVIVPGAFGDGSGWRVVHDILYHKGYKVTVAQPPHTSLDDDVAVARKTVFQQFGNVVLVGHGIGGAVMSNVATGAKVKALVYVAALVPEIGETSQQLMDSMPGATDAIKADRAGFQFFDAAKFHADYAHDMTVNRANFLAASQVPVSTVLLGTPSTFAAWHKKPSYGIVATRDRIINPDLQRWMYKRAGARITEIGASHAVHISQPEEVAKVIEQAALGAR
ncbi:alpha/beta hydrolase [Massilia niastensis]|uniref:alpha/beta hydrolase n=1 Tax=Massilia niastensis TaxID=544911 RepID=UPI0012EB840A|nr:alpha/beta hydrolase [Massilia niastensis]